LTRPTAARYYTPRADRRFEPSVLWEVADVVEQIFRIAWTENLTLFGLGRELEGA